jgi:hypothetical protein
MIEHVGDFLQMIVVQVGRFDLIGIERGITFQANNEPLLIERSAA